MNLDLNAVFTIIGIGFITVVNVSVRSYISISVGKRGGKTPPPEALYLQELQNMHALRAQDVNDIKSDL